MALDMRRWWYKRTRPLPAGLPGQRFRLEPLEPRLLLAADPIGAAGQAVLSEGLAGLQRFAEQLQRHDELGRDLPLLVSQGSGAALSLGGALDLADVVKARLVDPVAAYLQGLGGGSATSEGLAAAIGATDLSDGKLLLSKRFDETRSDASFFSFGKAGDAIQLSSVGGPTFSLDTTVGFDLAIGFDPDPSLSPADAFFVRLSPITFGAKLAAANVSFPVNLGFLGASVGGGALGLDVSLRAQLANPDGDANGDLTISELLGTSMGALATVDVVGAAANTVLPVSASVGGWSLAEGTQVTIVGDPYAAGGLVLSIVGAGADDVRAFGRATADSVIGIFDQVVGLVDQLGRSGELDTRIPLVAGDVAFGDLLGLDQVLEDGLLDPLRDVPVPDLDTAQEFAGKLGSILGLSPAQIGASFDPVLDRLHFEVAVGRTFAPIDEPLALNFPLDSLRDVVTSSTVRISAQGEVAFGLDIDLSPFSARLSGAVDLPASGVLSSDAAFEISVNGAVAVPVVVARKPGNTNRNQLVADLNAALAAAGLSGVTAQLAGARVALVTPPGDFEASIFIVADAANAATTELGLAQAAVDGIAFLDGGAILPVDGRLTSDAAFRVKVNGEAGFRDVLVRAADTTGIEFLVPGDPTSGIAINVTPQQVLAKVVTKALREAGARRVEAFVTDGRLALRVTNPEGPASLQVSAAAGSTAATQLGIPTSGGTSAPGAFGTASDAGADRALVSNLRGSGRLNLSAADVDADANFGFVGIRIENGTAGATGALDFTALSGVPIRLLDFFDRLENLTGTFALQSSLAANLDLPVAIAPPFPLPLGPNPRITASFSNLLQPAIPPTLSFPGLDSLIAFRSFDSDDVIAGLRGVASALRAATQLPLLGAPLPLVGQELDELLGFATRFSSQVEALANGTPIANLQTLEQRLEQALGVASSDLTVSVPTAGDLRVSFAWSPPAVSRNVGLNVPLGSSVPSATILATPDPVLRLDASLAATVVLGFDLSNSALPRAYLDDASEIVALVHARNLQPLGFSANVGPLRTTVSGSARLSQAGGGGPAQIRAGLATSPNQGRWFLDSFGIGQFAVTTQGEIRASLVTALGPEIITYDVSNLASLPVPSIPAALASRLQSLIATQNLSNQAGAVVDGLDLLFASLQQALKDQVFRGNLPLVGDDIGRAMGFLDDLRSTAISRLEQAIAGNGGNQGAEFLRDQLFLVLGSAPGGLDLIDPTFTPGGGAGSTKEDIQLVTVDPAGSQGRIEFRTRLKRELTLSQIPIYLDLGLPGFDLRIDPGSQVLLLLGWQLALTLGVSKNDGAYIGTAAADELVVDFQVRIPDVTARGSVGFLRATIADEDADADPNNRDADVDGDGARNSAFQGTFTVDLRDPSGNDRLTPGELATLPLSQVLSPRLEAVADVNLELALGFEPGGEFSELPRLLADLQVDWIFNSTSGLAGTKPDVRLVNGKIDLGRFLATVVKPFVDTVQTLTGPVAPILEILNEKIPVVSDLAGRKITILDLAKVFGEGFATAATFVSAVADVVALAETFDSVGDDVFIDVGALDLTFFDFRDPLIDLTKVDLDIPSIHIDPSSSPGSQLEVKAVEFSEGYSKTTGGGFKFPIFDKPASAFDLIFGKDVDLIRYDVPRLDLGFKYSYSFPLPTPSPIPIVVRIAGKLSAIIDFEVGYDTRGFRTYSQSESKNALLLFDGFFVGDTVDGKDVPEVKLEGKLSAGAGLSIGIAEVGVEGGVFAAVNFNLKDSDADGKMRGGEIFDALSVGGPFCIFDVTGEMGAFLGVYWRVGIGPFSISGDYEIARVTLFEFPIGLCDGPPPKLATLLSDGTLLLNMGPRAGERLAPGDRGDRDSKFFTDGDEAFTVSSLTGDTVIVKAFGLEQAYGKVPPVGNPTGPLGPAVLRIVADGGLGNDSIEIEPDILYANQIFGGDGDDVLLGGGGRDEMRGGIGRDTIQGRGDVDTIFGDAGDDVLGGGEGNDTIEGGDGADRLVGGIGNDVLRGGAGEDNLRGDEGNDQLFGDLDRDGLYGGIGQDLLFGGGGVDRLEGEDDDDELSGDAGADEIIGGRGVDRLYGHSVSGASDDGAADLLWGDLASGGVDEGAGADLLFGQGGDDTLHGEAGNDELRGGAGADTIFGEAGEDLILGESGADTIFGGAARDEIHGGQDGDAISGGDAEDLIYGDEGNDRIFGDGADDLIFAGLGDDEVVGGLGEDRIFGGGGNDALFGQEGDDLLLGEDGNDRLFGNGGFDVLRGGLGNDALTGGFDADRLHGEEGGDFVYGASGNDWLFGEDGNDFVSGGDDDDLVDGGAGNDELLGGLGEDYLLTGAGLLGRSFGGDGDDVLIGSDEGSDDPDFDDAIRFGDLLDGGAGDDTILGLGGADIVIGGAGNDFVDGGVHGDFVRGGAGDDRLLGALGNDRLEGETGDDFLDGEWGTDLLRGGAGRDELVGGGGVGDRLEGGDDDDVLQGSDDGADLLFGDAGNDRIFGNGGSDALSGGAGDDVLEGGAGDDLLEGGAGSDVLLGGANHDTLYASTLSSPNDEVLVNFLYGDFGTNVTTAGQGADRLFGSAGSDLLFGEGGDDQILPGGGAADVVDFGIGEGANPADFVQPSATPAPSVAAYVSSPRATSSLPTVPAANGRWRDLGASGYGLSGDLSPSLDPALVVDAFGQLWAAWADARNGNFEIYVARRSPGGTWQPVSGSASGGGVSRTTTSSRRPVLLIDPVTGQPIVVWTEAGSAGSDLLAARLDPAANGGQGAWVALGTSLSAGGLSATGGADFAQAVATASGPVVAWIDVSTGAPRVYAKRFSAGSWIAAGVGAASGSGLSGASVVVGELALASDGAKVAAAWTAQNGAVRQVQLRELVGSAWNALGPSAAGAGVSQTSLDATAPTVAYLGTELFVAWQQARGPDLLPSEIYAVRWNGAAFVAAGAGANAVAGLSGTSGAAFAPKLAAGGGKLHLLWSDDSPLRREGAGASLFARRWSGSAFVEEIPGDAQAEGVSSTGGVLRALVVAVDGQGHPFVAWQEATPRRPEIFVRGNEFDVLRVFQANASTSVAQILAGNDLGAGDVIVVAAGTQGGFDVGANDAGVLIVGAPEGGTQVAGAVTVAGAPGTILQNLVLVQDVSVSGSNGATLVDNRIGGTVRVGTSAGVGIVGNRWVADGTSLELGAGTSDVVVAGNRFESGTTGIRIAAATSGRISANEIGPLGTGIEIAAAFTGAIDGNVITGAATGVLYGARAELVGNRIRNGGTGVRTTVASIADALGFVGGFVPNEISGNATGIELAGGRVQGQHVFGNGVGVGGTGTLGGDDAARASHIERNGTGVLILGNVQYSRIGHNGVGIQATTTQAIHHNEIFDNTTAGVLVAGQRDVRIASNTFYTGTGDNVRIENASSEVDVRNNVLSTDGGYDLYVANDSHTGFFSDWNDLHASGSGKLVFFTRDFTDLLDWQADVARYDLHSIGTTGPAPFAATPGFRSYARDDYRVFALSAQLRATSPTIDSGDPRIDVGAPASPPNLLVNAGFENGLTGWNTTAASTVRTGAPAAFDGAGYFAPPTTAAAAFAEQRVDLVAAGFSAAQLDGGTLDLLFGGRLRVGSEFRTPGSIAPADRGRLVLIFENGAGTEISRVVEESANSAERWDLVGSRVAIPIGTRRALLRFEADRITPSSNDAYFDAAVLRVLPDSLAPDLGAFSQTAQEPPASFAHLKLRSPDLYTDWERDRPRTIAWQSVGNSGNSSVRIDLLQDGPGGPALLTTIAAATADDGEFVWIPSSSGVAFGTKGLRIQISLVQNPLVRDRSTEAFSVPEDGNEYFVDDRSNEGDVFTGAATGSNRNTGKRADAPKPNPVNLVRVYDLGPGAVLRVDTGDYDLFETLRLSGSAARGLGLNEAFTLQGPGNVNATARLFSANPLVRLPAILELDDADLMDVSGFTLERGEYGFVARNGVEDLRLRDVTARDHTLDAIRISSSSPTAEFTGLVATGAGQSGIVIDGPLARLADSRAFGNALHGFRLTDLSTALRDARVERLEAAGNRYGIEASTSLGRIFVGNADLALGLGSLVHENVNVGIYAGNNTTVAGNAVFDHAGVGAQGIVSSLAGAQGSSSAVEILRNLVYANDLGILGGRALVRENRVYQSGREGISAFDAGVVDRNVVYGAKIGIRGGRTVSGNLVYGTTEQAFLGNQRVDLIGNTFYALQGNAVELRQFGSNPEAVSLRNNILVAANGYAISTDRTTETVFTSDFNLFHVFGNGRFGNFAGTDRTTLAAWRAASFGDAEGLEADPLFVDPDGADGFLGFASPASDGRDDDFHLQSSFGSFRGALAPVRSTATGLPVFPGVTAATDALLSPALDRGAPADPFAEEPVPNGGFVNLGAFGSHPQASKSPAQYLLVTTPNGGEGIAHGTTRAIRWRSAGFAGNVRLEYSGDGGQSFVTIAANEANDGVYDWSVEAALFPASASARIRISSLSSPGVQDLSDGTFRVTPPIAAYYVNDDSTANDEYTSAVGSDLNDGLDPSRPKSSLRSVLDTYDLGPNDVIYVDTGVYRLTTSTQLVAQDSGVRIQGPTGTGRNAILERGANALFGQHVIELAGADDVTLDRLFFRNADTAVRSTNGGDSDRITITASGFERVFRGVDITPTNDGWVVSGSAFANPDGPAFSVGVSATTAARIETSSFAGITVGIDVSNGSLAVGNDVAGTTTYGIRVGSGGRAEGNRVHGVIGTNAQSGIEQTGGDVVGNEIFENKVGLRSTGGRAVGNRIYGNTTVGALIASAELRENQIYGQPIGVETFGTATILNNVIYQHSDAGIRATQAGVRIESNTFLQLAGDAVRFSRVDGSSVRNNVFVIEGGTGQTVLDGTASGFTSDWNVYQLAAGAVLGRFEGRSFTDLADWFSWLGLDRDGLQGDARLAGPRGADGILGYAGGVDRGEDDDFHLRGDSPAVDRGDPASAWLREPSPNGGRIDAGAYGNTAEATRSAAQTVQVLSPNGLDRLETGEPATIRFRTDGFTPTRTIALVNAGGPPVSSADRGSWSASSFLVQGNASPQQLFIDVNTIDTSLVANPPPLSIYSTGLLSDDFTANKRLVFGVPVEDGTYRVRLHFLSRPFASDTPIDILANGVLVRDDFSIAAASGNPSLLRAVTEDVAVTASGGSGFTLSLVQTGFAQFYLHGFEILQDAAGAPASPTATVELSTDGGGSWQTLSDAVPIDRFGEGRLDFVPTSATQGATALVRVRMNQGTQPQDVSDRFFSIAPAGKAFYVNDGSTAGDEYATAIGSNANDGKSAARPMASLAGLLASYDLGPGDIVYVDTGVYQVPRNIAVALDDSGVRIQGPVAGGHQARFERGNRGQASAVFELTGADDVTFDHLTFTNAGRGILAGTSADSDRIVVSGSEFFDLDSGGLLLDTSNDSARVAGNRFHDLLAPFSSRVLATSGTGALVEDNVLENVLGGIDVRDGTVRRNQLRAAGGATGGTGISLGSGLVLDNDVRDYSALGIFAGSNGAARVEGNRIRMSAAATLGGGIAVGSNVEVIGNDVFGAREGINGGTRIVGNRVYGQSEVGIGSLFNSGGSDGRVISGNVVFGTKVGINLTANSIDHNLVYDVSVAGIVANVGGGRQFVEHNTVYAAVGAALRVDGIGAGAADFGFSNLRVRNNVLWAGSGDALSVTSGAVSNLVSDYNLVFLEGGARFGTYSGTSYATREAWSYAVGHDANSRVGDPRFVNPAGPDGVLGFDGADRGKDDDFRFLPGSPAIDLGDPASLFLFEPGPNGARANAGHLGNTADALASPSETVFLLSPNGLEKLEVGQSVSIDWGSSGLAAWRSVALLDLGASTNPRRAADGRWWITDSFRDPAASGFETQYASGVTVDLSGVSGAAPAEAYQTWRQTQGGPVRYVLPLVDGTYRVRLHFTASGIAAGTSVSTVLLNGEVVDAALDPFPVTGGFTSPVKAGTASYDVEVTGGEGLTFEIRTNAGKEALRLAALELLAEDASGASAPTADLELSLDGGQTYALLAKDAPMNDLGIGRFTWTAGPETAGSQARIRVTANRGGRPSDVSDASFAIANAGNAYYVNDGSLAGDEYTTAVGNDLNDGKSPDRPMQSLFALIRAYDLDAGDVVYVDTGTHVAKRDLTLEAQDSGVRFQGPELPGHQAIVDRSSPGAATSNPFVFEVAGANDVVLDRVSMTGASRGVGFRGFADGDRWTISGGELFGLGTGVDVTQSGDGWRIIGNRIRDVGTGVRNIAGGTLVEGNEVFGATSVGISSNRESMIRGNEVYGNNVGIEAGAGIGGPTILAGPFTEVVDNLVRDNLTTGISLNGGRAERNQVFGHTRANAQGMTGTGLFLGNVIFGNSTGLRFGGGLAEGNAIYGNTVEGINLQSSLGSYDNQIRDNAIHSNPVGIRSGQFFFGGGTLTIANNRAYANADAGFWFSSGNNLRVVSNTIFQSAGDGLRVDGGSNLLFQSNIVWVDAGAVLSVSAAGQTGFRSDYNDLFTGPAAAAAVGRFGGVLRSDLAAWRAASGGDANSIGGDPLLVDLDGADNVLGEKGLPEGDGFDDNLALRKGSPAIDRGNGYVSPLLDAEGLPRTDDPATPNGGVGFERFVETAQAGSAFSATGSTSFAGTLNLPFAFRFYGTDYTQVRIGQSGFLQFGPQVQLGNERENSLDKLRSVPMIAPLWDDYFTSSVPGAGIFVDTTTAGQVTVRWTGARSDPQSGQVASTVNASVTLFQNGSFRFDYGAGNAGMTPTVGLSAGNGVTFVASQYDGQANLGGAASLLFTPTPGLVFFDMGAYEFQGRSDDAVPPRVTNVIGLPADNGTTAAAFSTIQIAFSETLQGISATSPANYVLVEDGADGAFDTIDDVRIDVRPAYSFPETNVVLTLPGGVLADGRYRLTLSGQNAILDASGNRLDGNGDGTGGDDFVRTFRIDRSTNRAPVATPQARNVSEDGSILITLAATDLDGDPLVYSLVGGPDHGTLAEFDAVARTVRYTPTAEYNGADGFTFRVDDGKAGVSTAQVSLTITPVNDAPAAAPRSVDVESGTPTLVVLDGTDVETPRASLVFTLAEGPDFGTLVFGAAGNWTYTPAQGYAGPDSFSYTVRDGGDPEGTAGNRITTAPITVSLTVKAAAGVPQAVAQSVQVAEDGSLLITLGVVADAGVTALLSIVAAPAHGTLESFDPVARTVVYRPAADYSGPDSFRFRAASGIRGTEAEVSIQVTPVNDAPVVAAIPAKTVKAGQLLTFTASATDVDGGALSFSLLDAPAGAGITPGGVFTWTPTAAQVAAQPYVIRVVVSDSGVPALAGEQPVSVTVQAGGPVLPGDANGDGIVNFGDLAIVRQQFLQTGPGKSADFNGDGVVNFADLAILRQNFLRTLPKLPGDANGDGIVNFGDLAIVRQQFLQTGPGKTADFNGDGVVNFADLAILRQNFLRTTAPGDAPVAPVAAGSPEPAAAIAATARVERGAQIGAGAVVGEGSIVRRDARVGARARLGRDVVVERGAVVPDDAVVLDGTVIPGKRRVPHFRR